MVNEQSNPGDEVMDDDDENFTVDFGGVQESVREVLPKGDYSIVVSEAEYTRSQSSNQPMWAIVLEIEEGDFTGRKIYTNLSFSPKALPMTKAVIKVLKPELLEGAFNPKKTADDGELLGLHAKVRVKHQMYNGEKQARVDRWMASTNGANAFLG